MTTLFTAAVTKVDSIVQLLHHHGLSTSLVGYDDTDWLHGNSTSSNLMDVNRLLQDSPWLNPSCFLVLGDFDFVLQVLREVSDL